MTGLDAGRFPRLAAYLARLPRGVDSFPEALSKGSALRPFIESTPLAGFPFEAVPPAVAQLLREPPLHSSWIREVGMMSAFAALADHRKLSAAALERWAYEQNRALLDTRTYRALVALAGPSLLMRGVQLRWGAFHRGSTLELLDSTEGSGTLVLRFPPWLFDDVLIVGFATAIRAALELSRARQVTVHMVEHTPRSARFEARWV